MNAEDILLKREKEKRTVSLMIEIYCHKKHGTKTLCKECKNLLEYAHARIEYCPHMATKSFCSKCKTHCYKKDMRERIREVMRFSGPRMIFYSPLLVLRHGLERFKR